MSSSAQTVRKHNCKIFHIWILQFTYYHYVSDEMGSITHVTDENGTVCNRYEYDAFGDFTVREETVHNRFAYAGEQYDPITGLYYLRARFYNPVIGRFIQEDTYYGDGLNLYTYCQNNPVKYVDPSGHEGVCVQKQEAINKLKESGMSDAEAESYYNRLRADGDVDATLEKIKKEFGENTDKDSIDYDTVKDYLNDIKNKTGYSIHKTQLEKLKEKLRTTVYSKLTPEETAKHRRQFTTKVKNKCIEDWEKNTGQKWPRYTEPVYGKNGTIVRNIGDPYDAHHIIENCYDGNHEWWNITPAKFPDEHQGGIHGTDSPCSKLFN